MRIVNVNGRTAKVERDCGGGILLVSLLCGHGSMQVYVKPTTRIVEQIETVRSATGSLRDRTRYVREIDYTCYAETLYPPMEAGVA